MQNKTKKIVRTHGRTEFQIVEDVPNALQNKKSCVSRLQVGTKLCGIHLTVLITAQKQRLPLYTVSD